MKAQISISRGSDDKVRIRIRDEASGIEFVQVALSLEAYAQTITGLSGVECEMEVRGLEHVGKVVTVESRRVECPLDTYDRGELEQWLVENCQEEGWILSPHLRSQSSIVQTGGKTVLNYSVRRYV